MTARGRWLVFLSLLGLGLGHEGFGQLRLIEQPVLNWLSLTVLVWIFVEWLWFQQRLLLELPRLSIERTINGRSMASGILWAGRPATVDVTVSAGGRKMNPLTIVRDCVPENFRVVDGHSEITGLHRSQVRTVTYRAVPGGAGRVTLPGFNVSFQDACGLFSVQRFVACSQTFRVLPAFAQAGDTQPIVKRINSQPRHGIHRLQRAGLGSELLELRDYVSGDPPKSIAWKVSARRDRLMTRQYESEVPVRVHFFVDGSVSVRAGSFGRRLLDQMLYVVASAGRAAVSGGDSVGAILFDEYGTTRLPASGGERGFYRLLENLSDFAHRGLLPPVPNRAIRRLVDTAFQLAGERVPELLDSRVNLVPFSIFPILPWNNRAFRRRTLLANVFAEYYDLTPLETQELVIDDFVMSRTCQHFLMECGVAWREPLVGHRTRGFHDGLSALTQVGRMISQSVAVAKDNEVYVITANLLECSSNLSAMMPAVKMALARHHRVVVVCPTPTFRRPGELPAFPEDATISDLLDRAENLRTRELSTRLTRTLRRVGAAVALSGEEDAIRLIMTEANLARSGRASYAGAPS